MLCPDAVMMTPGSGARLLQCTEFEKSRDLMVQSNVNTRTATCRVGTIFLDTPWRKQLVKQQSH